MRHGNIISRAESLRILENDLRRAALERRAADLKEASPEKREEIRAQIDQDIRAELRRRTLGFEPDALLH
jgi:hypothetical protein